MKTLGIFEIKTKLSQVCEDVAATGESVLVTKRGKPFVRIDPLEAKYDKQVSVWDVREAYLGGESFEEDIILPVRERDAFTNPLEENKG